MRLKELHLQHRFRTATLGLCLATAGLPLAQAQVSVDSGQPRYAYAFKLPPGVGGLTPSLGVVYTGNRAGEGVGHGWGLSGSSSIARCAPMHAIDGEDGTTRFNGDDKLCLDGRRLIQVDANGVTLPFPQKGDATGLGAGAVREFRLESDPHTRVRAYGSAQTEVNRGPQHFQVQTADGRIRTYGQHPTIATSAKATWSNGPVLGWAISRVQDAAGNIADYSYEQNWVWLPPAPSADAVEWVLSTIEYGGNVSNGTPHRAKVLLKYSDDPHAADAHVGGSRRAYKRYLSAVEATVTGSPALRITRLGYLSRSFTQRSLLNSIKECVRATATAPEKCQPATALSYTNNSSVNYVVDTNWTKDASGAANRLASAALLKEHTMGGGTLQGDFNGDGRIDLLNWSQPIALFLSEGQGAYREISATAAGLGGYSLFSQNPCKFSHVADYDGDGLDDIAVFFESAFCMNGTTDTSSLLFRSKGDGTFERKVMRMHDGGGALQLMRQVAYFQSYPSWTKGYQNFFVADFNRDGRLDILQFNLQGWTKVRPGHPTSRGGLVCDPNYDSSSTLPCEVNLWLGNGDGSFVRTKPQPFNGDTEVWAPYIPHPQTYRTGSLNEPRDIDGDGVPDLLVPARQLYYADGAYQWFYTGYLLGQRSGNFVASSRTPLSNQDSAYQLQSAGDLNGDGLPDMLLATYVPSYSSYLYFEHGAENVRPYSMSSVKPGIALDINGDGRSDVLSIYNGLPNTIYLTSPTGRPSAGAFNASSLKDLMFHMVGNEGTSLERAYTKTLFGNFSGSGHLEFLVINSDPVAKPNKLYVRESTVPVDLLETVTSETGIKTTFSYEPITRTQAYASDRGTAFAAMYPHAETGALAPGQVGPTRTGAIKPRDSTPSMFVVTSSKVDSGVDSAVVESRYAYRGFKTDQQGRGSLGFREIRIETDSPDGVSKLTTVQTRLQGHPYTGSPAVTEVYLGAMSPIAQAQTGQLLSRTENVYCDQTAAAGAENTATVSAPCPTTSKVFKPYVRKSSAWAWDLSGAALPSTVTTTTYSGGYPTLIEKTSTGVGPAGSQTFTQRTVNDYWPDNTTGDNWILGLVKKSTQSSSVPNASQAIDAIPAAAGTNPKATATKGP